MKRVALLAVMAMTTSLALADETYLFMGQSVHELRSQMNANSEKVVEHQLTKFDTTKGTLQGVRLKGRVTVSHQIGLTNNSVNNLVGSARYDAFAGIRINGLDMWLPFPPIDTSKTLSTTFAAGDQLNATRGFDLFLTSPEHLQAFQMLGMGSTTVRMLSSTHITFVTGANRDVATLNGTADSELEVTYAFAPVPEPASMMILAPAVAFLIRRRRR